ncbi:MAG: tRNA-uridine aminocarboxypropyltransferase [Bdellovibrionota bacterium]
MQTGKKARCPRCRLHAELCLCAECPQLSLRTRVVVLMHAQEFDKPSNTGRLASLCLPNSELRLRGIYKGPPLSLDGLVDDEYETWMLCLTERSEELTPALVVSARKPVRLLVPDGTWAQASRLSSQLARKLPPSVRHVKLGLGAPSEYRLRTEHLAEGLATFEAIARALGYLEGPAVQEKLEALFRVMTDRVLYMRGKLGAEEVRGGVPGK